MNTGGRPDHRSDPGDREARRVSGAEMDAN